MKEVKYDNTIKVESWDQFIERVVNKFPTDNWLFRGEKKFSWELASLIERSARDYGIDFQNLAKYEQGMIRKFHRNICNYYGKKIERQNYFEIMAMMQHFGCPTRLLDFSHSAYIALFFAIENATTCIEQEPESAIWIFNSGWLDRKYQDTSPEEYKKKKNDDPFEKTQEMMKIILNDKRPFVKHIGPYEMNDRMLIQQGTFLIQLDITKSFIENLYESSNKEEVYDNVKKIKIKITKELLNSAYAQLYRMNITRMSLFPGIDGFASHLKMLMLLPNTISWESEIFA